MLDLLTGGKPLCALCVHELEWRVQQSWSRLAVFVLVSIGLSFWLSRHVPSDLSTGAWVAVLLVAIVGVFVTKSRTSKAKGVAEAITRREPGLVTPIDALERPAHPYWARLGRVAVAPIPTLSARTTAVVVGLSLLVTGVLLPVALKLPSWVEFELVLAVWWTMSSGFLAVLLHRGTRVREDHAFRVRWNLPDIGAAESQSGRASKGWGWLNFDPGCADAEGCAGVLVGVLLAAVAVAAAWFVVELAFPAAFFLLYWLVVKAIARVANDPHGCERSVSRSIAWGALWATLYTLPIAVVVWGVHLILAAKPHG